MTSKYATLADGENGTQVERNAEPLEGLAKSGSEACLHALRECSPAKRPSPLAPQTLPTLQARPKAECALAIPTGDPGVYRRIAELLESRRSAPPAPASANPTGSGRAPMEVTQSGPGALGRTASACCSADARASPVAKPGFPELRLGSPAVSNAPEEAAPGRPRRPAWLEEAAARVSQGISLRSCASVTGLSALATRLSAVQRAASFPELPVSGHGAYGGAEAGEPSHRAAAAAKGAQGNPQTAQGSLKPVQAHAGVGQEGSEGGHGVPQRAGVPAEGASQQQSIAYVPPARTCTIPNSVADP